MPTLPSPQTTPFYVPPGGWLGLLGGGQLGRMFCHAAQSLGYRVAVLDPAPDGPAAQVAERHIRAAFDDAAALAELARLCPAVTTEFENVPAASLRALACAVSPGADAVAVAQDRIAEKAFVAGLGVAVAPHAAVTSEADLADAAQTLFPGILKAARLGYDGKGQVWVADRAAARAAWHDLGGVPCVLEAQLALQDEVSVVLARGRDGQTACLPLAQNVHRDGILAVTTVADDYSPALADVARAAARTIADALDYCGVLCVEFFVLADGSPDGTLLVNEIAPRPHNSGHYSLDACTVSQFELQVRALAGLPLGQPRLLAPAVMLNLLGDLWFDANGQRRAPDWAGVLAVPEAKLHLYGKAEARRGRKMGHVTCSGDTLAQARARADQVAAVLGLPAVTVVTSVA